MFDDAKIRKLIPLKFQCIMHEALIFEEIKCYRSLFIHVFNKNEILYGRFVVRANKRTFFIILFIKKNNFFNRAI